MTSTSIHVNPTDLLDRLVGLVAALPATTAPGDAGLIPVTATAEGEIVWVYSRGQYRRGIVTKVTRTRAEVSYTTQGALDESARIYAVCEPATEDDATSAAARQARQTWAFKTTMADGTNSHYTDFASLYTPERKQKEMAEYAAEVEAAGSKEAYVQAEIDRARTAFQRRKAANTGPLAYVKVTRKVSKIVELYRDAAV
ncbi:hypothetical protein ACFWYW_46900 [Nonomuraea sp. NPDC059023]|uniref:hypothetical protein n=1 Tax=unclassified Nonomuraea TaxID=2593643 RepID=UPI0036A6A0B5